MRWALGPPWFKDGSAVSVLTNRFAKSPGALPGEYDGTALA
jgi:hypothetical protein